MQTNSGLDSAELTLTILRPEEAGTEPSEALDRLTGVCWHTYPMPGGRGWQFRYEPNILKQIEERAGQISIEDARKRVEAEAQEYFGGPIFGAPVAWPSQAKQVTDSPELQLVICGDEKTATSPVCANCDDSNPKAPIPRKYINAIVAATGDPESALNRATDAAQRLKAIEALEKEHKEGDTAKMVREQLQRAKPNYLRSFRLQTYRAFDRVLLAGEIVYPLEEQYQVAEDQMLQRPRGQECLMRFLQEKSLIYKSGDALDPDRFLKNVLPGATPTIDQPGAYTARAVFERFLAAPGLRLVPDQNVVRQTILRALADGKLVVRLSNGCAFDSAGCVDGPPGKRRRIPGKTLTGLEVRDDKTMMTVAGSDAAKMWTKEDPVAPPKTSGGDTSDDDVPEPPRTISTKATTWDKAIEMATEQPLKEITLSAATPAAAAALLNLAGPVGADVVTLTLTVGGPLKDSGTIQLAISDMKPSHPLKPLTMAQTIHNSLTAGSNYEAVLKLTFTGDGRTGMADAIRKLQLDTPDDVEILASFGTPVGMAA